MCCTVCFLRTKIGPTLVDTSIAKTVEYGVLKTHVHCMKIDWFRQSLVFNEHCLEDKL
jgi:hypothetical protein